MKNYLKVFILSLIGLFFLNGCSLHYYDPKTKAEHVYGIGHMVMKVQDAGDNRVAIIKGFSSIGVSGGTNDEGAYFGAGWSSHRNIQILEPNTKLDLLWPSSDFLNLRIGEDFSRSQSTTHGDYSTEKKK